MGMYGRLRRVKPSDLERLRADPKLLEAFLFGVPPVVVEDRMPGFIGFLLRLTPIKVQRVEPAPEGTEPAWPAAAPGEEADLEKAWHGLHFLLTGTDDGGEEPACFLMSGGEYMGDNDDVDVRALSPDQVRDFAAFLATLSTEELTRRFDPVRMTQLKIYPEIWMRPEEEDEPRGYLLGAFDGLRDLVTSAAAAGDAVVVCIS